MHWRTERARPGLVRSAVRVRQLCRLILALAALVVIGSTPALTRGDGDFIELEPGVRVRELERGGQTLWLYQPVSQPPRGLVAIAPSGGTLLTAPGLGPGDRAEHLPYARAGFYVVSFSLSGELSGSVTREQVRNAIAAFAEAEIGVQDGRSAIDSALRELGAPRNLPIFAAGHSSAANLALALGARESRIRGVAAYAPAIDVLAFVEGNALARMAREIPGALEVAGRLAPIELANTLATPSLVFHAEDDATTSFEGSREFIRRLESRGVPARFVSVPTGGHYDAMLEAGIPAGIAWFTELLDRATDP